MKKILFLYGVIWGLLISYSAQSKEYECDIGNGKTITYTLLDMGGGDMGYAECKKGKLYVRCDSGLEKVLPECEGKNKWDSVEIGNGDSVSGYQQLSKAMEQVRNQRREDENSGIGACDLGNQSILNNHGETTSSGQYIMCRDGRLFLEEEKNGNILNSKSISVEEACIYLPEACGIKEQSQANESVQAEYPSTTSPDAGKILDTKTESGKKTDLSSQSVTGSTKQPTIDGTAAMQNETGKTTSGNVEKSSFVGSSNLSSEYYGSGSCGGGNIFQQLACRAGTIGSGLKTAGYMIAGFGLIVFSFAAIFGKVKWPLFATIMFSCFLLSATVFVVNMMTKNGDASWIGGIKSSGFDYNSTTTPQGNVDKVAVTKETM